MIARLLIFAGLAAVAAAVLVVAIVYAVHRDMDHDREALAEHDRILKERRR